MFNVPTLLAFSALFASITPGGEESAPRPAAVEVRPEVPVRYQAAVAPAIASSLATYPDARRRYLDGLPRKTSFIVSVRLGGDGPCAVARVKVSDIDEKKGLIYGRAQEDVTGRFGIHQDDDVTVHEADVIDWKIVHPDGSEEGNVLGKYIASLGPGVNVPDILMDQRDKYLSTVEKSTTVETAVNQTFLQFFDDKDLKVESEPSTSPALRQWPSLARKYHDLAPAALVAELNARAAAVKATRKVTVEDQVFKGKEVVLVAAYVVLKKGDVVYEVMQYLHFYYTDKKVLDRVEWGAREGRWIVVDAKPK